MDVKEAIREAVEMQKLNGTDSAAFLASLRSNGFVVVPVEATEKMHHAARDWSIKKYGQGVGRDGSEGCWNAMLAASQENDQ